MLAEGKGFCVANTKIRMKSVTCEDGFEEEAAWLGAWCGLGGCLGSFWFFRGAVRPT